MPLFLSFLACNFEYLNGRFVFFVLAFTFPNENTGMFHYDMDCIYMDCTFLFHFFLLLFLGQTLYNNNINNIKKKN